MFTFVRSIINKHKVMYHISRHYLGQIATFQPRIPVSQNKCEVDLGARVCAANTLEQCWNAIKVCNDLIDEMQKNNTSGYYFFVYKFKDTSSFIANTAVKDFDKTGEIVSYTPVDAELSEVFYVNRHKLRNPFNCTDDRSGAKEEATFEEAIAAYNEWQKDDLINIEDIIKEM